ncbi:proteasome accessory factor PafA2 family protein [Gimesia chilikensis]|uniref:Pup--protein ligase n=1 Tax=Gimesia chilikensis TaxID=2605989 RepID=A0A517PSY7_9PLAN|nr:proteasome accessory factor PafA2 family protein [Gimesia chilikensis]QDT22487.1 Pup--protein ligase [Gimesia chilikensis]
MPQLDPQRFVLGTEIEYLTAVPDCQNQSQFMETIRKLFDEIKELVPTANCTDGVFTPYGRFYLDGTHLELAVAEADSPFSLVQMRNSGEMILKMACQRLAMKGTSLFLANCNHSGILSKNSPTWGTHGNILIEVPPQQLPHQMLPFLASHSYTGSGGRTVDTGQWVGSTRLLFLESEQGGATTTGRALHSYARNEHLTRDPVANGYRYHTLWQDACRSHFSQLLQSGITALVLKAVIDNPDSIRLLPERSGDSKFHKFWLQAARTMNVLISDEDSLHVDPYVIELQRLYLQLIDQYIAKYPDSPEWTRQVAAIWETTLNKMEQGDVDWLSVRLDPWIKHKQYSEFLKMKGASWADVTSDQYLTCELTALNQSYHNVSSENSLFDYMEERERIKHRVTNLVAPGEEAESYVPKVHTRAQTRARLLKQFQESRGLSADWDQVQNPEHCELFLLSDPYAVDEHRLVLPSH